MQVKIFYLSTENIEFLVGASIPITLIGVHPQSDRRMLLIRDKQALQMDNFCYYLFTSNELNLNCPLFSVQ